MCKYSEISGLGATCTAEQPCFFARRAREKTRCLNPLVAGPYQDTVAALAALERQVQKKGMRTCQLRIFDLLKPEEIEKCAEMIRAAGQTRGFLQAMRFLVKECGYPLSETNEVVKEWIASTPELF